jgi:hypothetical protein
LTVGSKIRDLTCFAETLRYDLTVFRASLTNWT